MRWFRRIPDSEAHLCDDDCGNIVEPFKGVRTAAGVFCSEECYNDQLAQRLS